MLYTIGVRTSTTTANTPALEVRTTSVAKPRIMELGFEHASGSTGSVTYGLGRAAAVGITPNSPTLAQDETDGNGPPALTKVATAWGTAPTIPANFFRRCTVVNSTVGVGYIWSFPMGLGMSISSSVVLWIIATSTGSPVQLDTWCVVDE